MDREPYRDKDYVIDLVEKDLTVKGLTHEQCYMGITNAWNIRKEAHHITNEWYKTYMVLTKSVAMNVEKHFTRDIQDKMEGGPGGGADDSCIVYVYEKSDATVEHTD